MNIDWNNLYLLYLRNWQLEEFFVMGNCENFDPRKFVCLHLQYVWTEMTHFLYCYAIAGSCKEPSKEPKGSSNESEEEKESKPFLSKSLVILVTITYSVY